MTGAGPASRGMLAGPARGVSRAGGAEPEAAGQYQPLLSSCDQAAHGEP